MQDHNCPKTVFEQPSAENSRELSKSGKDVSPGISNLQQVRVLNPGKTDTPASGGADQGMRKLVQIPMTQEQQAETKTDEDGADNGENVRAEAADGFLTRTLSTLYKRMSLETSPTEPSFMHQFLERAKTATYDEIGDYRVRLQSPQGEIPIAVWDLSKYPFWQYDHYQSLRREWEHLKGQPGSSPSKLKEMFVLPHPGVDYMYHNCPYFSQAGMLYLISMCAQSILPDGSTLPADVDASVKLPFFKESDYSLTCSWF